MERTAQLVQRILDRVILGDELHKLVLDEVRRRKHLVDIRLGAQLQLVRAALRGLHGIVQLVRTCITHGLHRLEALHLVLDGGLATLEIV